MPPLSVAPSDLSEPLRYIVRFPSAHLLEPRHSLIANPLIRKAAALLCPRSLVWICLCIFIWKRCAEDARWVYQYRRCRQCVFAVLVILGEILDAASIGSLRVG